MQLHTIAVTIYFHKKMNAIQPSVDALTIFHPMTISWYNNKLSL